MNVYKLTLFIVISILLVACAPQSNRVEISSTATHPACQPSQIQQSDNSPPEIKGTMDSDGELWALLFFNKAHANEDLKFVWRITGIGGEFTVQAQHENGITTLPIWGPEYHESSSWQRPGVEYGTGFNFPEPGCWTITVSRGATKGEIYLNVLPPQQN